MPHNDWVMATRTRFGITARWRALFRDIDAILCPAMPTPAFPHDHSPMDERLLDVDGTAARYADQVV
jgi:amidase